MPGLGPRLAKPAMALALALVACKSTEPNTTAADAAIPAERVKKLVSAGDCAGWAKHGVSVAIASYKGALQGCPQADREQFERQIESKRSEFESRATATCSAHVDKVYWADEAQCYVTATTAEKLWGCAFAPMVDPNDTDQKAVMVMLKKTCGKIFAPP